MLKLTGMKKYLLYTLGIVIFAGVIGVLNYLYVQKQKTEARASIDTAFNLMDVTKDYFDQFKSCLDANANTKLNDGRQFQLAGEMYDQSEKAFNAGEYSKAIDMSRESTKLTVDFRNQFDNVVIPMKTANLCL